LIGKGSNGDSVMRSLVLIAVGVLTTFILPNTLIEACFALGLDADLIRGTTAIGIFVVGLIIIAVGLYIFRNTHRIWYGSFEIAVGFLLMISAVSTYAELYINETIQFNFSDVPDHFKPQTQGLFGWRSTTVAMLQIAAAIYVLIRGLDNLGEGLRASSHSKWKLLWSRVFQTGSK